MLVHASFFLPSQKKIYCVHNLRPTKMNAETFKTTQNKKNFIRVFKKKKISPKILEKSLKLDQ